MTAINNRSVAIAAMVALGSSTALPALAQEKAPPPPSVTVGNISSANQGAGLTAGYIGSVNQTVLPTLVRGPLLDLFEFYFTSGANTFRTLARSDLNDQQILSLCTAADKWTNATYQWLKTYVSDYAAERFLFRTNITLEWSIDGTHSQEVIQCRTNNLNALSGFLQNLDALMREPSLYPDPTSKPAPAKPVPAH